MVKQLNRLILTDCICRHRKTLLGFLVLIFLIFIYVIYKNYTIKKNIELIEQKGGVFILKENSLVERLPNFLKSSARLVLLKEIRKVDLSVSTLKDHKLLRNCGTIKELATSMEATSIESLKYLTELENLSVGNLLFTDVSVLSKLKNLRNLFLYREVDSLEPIRSLTKLETLIICQISEDDLDTLKTLNALKGLGIRVEEVPEKLLQKLKSALPQCNISIGKR